MAVSDEQPSRAMKPSESDVRAMQIVIAQARFVSATRLLDVGVGAHAIIDGPTPHVWGRNNRTLESSRVMSALLRFV
ncbi:hypothetical protein VT50_0235910 [Streptomyces antioxidans]|uniref:Uncharacterized protein n=1 Tax=Streptomyces antioxidans TaxID=1507734 RepID=A0A1V4CU71_9ACTN|nr:hypothetical protein VT50_0235910 [Streptomyces antioxidans]